MIRVDDLQKVYPGAVALDGVTFSVGRGEIVGLLGPNGAGKTTTMRILTGLLAPTGGRARVAGHDVVAESLAVRRRVGYLPESAPLYTEMLVADYLRFVAAVRRVPRARRRAAVDAAVDRCGLGDVRGRIIGHLSKGFRQRVGLAQALLHDPDVLVLDEPTTGLDPNQLEEIRALVRALGREKTILFSSHVLPEVEAVASRVVIIHRGRIVADGPPRAIGPDARLSVLVAGAGAEAVAARLAALPTVAAVAPATSPPIDDGAVALTLTVQPGADARPQVFRAIAEAGWILLELRREAGDLERVFQRLTRSENRGAAA